MDETDLSPPPVTQQAASEPAASEPAASKWPEPLVENFDDPEWPQLSLPDEEVRRWVLENKKN
jgi:hypothetical protein